MFSKGSRVCCVWVLLEFFIGFYVFLSVLGYFFFRSYVLVFFL